MFQGFNSDLLSFYADIRFHNEKAFMDAHRKEYYQKVRDPFYAFIAEMAPVMLSIDPDMEVRPAKCLSRINRDTRYSRDKSPYRDHHWVAFRRAAAGKDGMPFYWFEIRLDAVNWGLGVWGENRPMMDSLRRRMVANPDEMIGLLRLLQKRDFSVGGTQWKKLRPPEDLPAVLILEGSSEDLASTIIRNTQSQDQDILVLDSMQAVSPQQVEAGASYLGLMEENLTVLQAALA